MKLSSVILIMAAGALSASAACAAKPEDAKMFNRPVTLIIPYSPGGSTDPVGRIVGPRLAQEIGQPVIVENKPGAAGALGAVQVARAAPDGHTMLLHTGVVAVHPNTMKNPGYDVRTDLIPVIQMVAGPYTLIANKSAPFNTVEELIAYGKANPDKLFYGTAGAGGSLHLLTEHFKQQTGLPMTHVPYKGNGPVVQALVGGDIQLAFDTVPGSKSLSDAGRVKALAVTSLERHPLLPDVPTLNELGLKGFEAETWSGIFLPKGTDPAIVQRYNEAIREVLKDPDVVKRMADIAYSIKANSPEEFAQLIETERKRWATTMKAAGMTPE
jgi:tripartite-type tricarboxylate transporter receptor subunit TctC